MALEKRDGGIGPFSLNSTPPTTHPFSGGGRGLSNKSKEFHHKTRAGKVYGRKSAWDWSCFRGLVRRGLSEEVTAELRAEKSEASHGQGYLGRAFKAEDLASTKALRLEDHVQGRTSTG